MPHAALSCLLSPTSPAVYLFKVHAVRCLGSEILLHGDSCDEACEHALTLARERNMTFVHPYDDPMVIAGQGTIGKEDRTAFQEFLGSLGFAYREETGNPAYRLFAGGDLGRTPKEK